MSGRPTNPIDNHQPPTPASTPSSSHPDPDSSDSESIGSDRSIHTAIPHHSDNTLPTMSTASEEFGTPAQRHTAYVTNLLHKTPIKPSLSASNYVAWSDSVRFGLSASSYDTFLMSDDIEGSGLDQD